VGLTKKIKMSWNKLPHDIHQMIWNQRFLKMAECAIHNLTITDEDLPFCPRTNEYRIRQIHEQLHKYGCLIWDEKLEQYYKFMTIWKEESDESDEEII
tara:strand:+ start:875 stop:1168 length:294 start_codon:yes stop_codon:yes gene_type:complete